ncbi:putative signal peptide protein [Puccinia sorghi]|uniref:Putative signal peptide protein n=1 Tax=Puccinia sorghi TaxID=27349 RepID=A0A0L6VSK4_9BASI|nr:putative signal peptide protein [Puccinia sorghi]
MKINIVTLLTLLDASACPFLLRRQKRKINLDIRRTTQVPCFSFSVYAYLFLGYFRKLWKGKDMGNKINHLCNEDDKASHYGGADGIGLPLWAQELYILFFFLHFHTPTLNYLLQLLPYGAWGKLRLTIATHAGFIQAGVKVVHATCQCCSISKLQSRYRFSLKRVFMIEIALISRIQLFYDILLIFLPITNQNHQDHHRTQRTLTAKSLSHYSASLSLNSKSYFLQSSHSSLCFSSLGLIPESTLDAYLFLSLPPSFSSPLVFLVPKEFGPAKIYLTRNPLLNHPVEASDYKACSSLLTPVYCSLFHLEIKINKTIFPVSCCHSIGHEPSKAFLLKQKLLYVNVKTHVSLYNLTKLCFSQVFCTRILIEKLGVSDHFFWLSWCIIMESILFSSNSVLAEIFLFNFFVALVKKTFPLNSKLGYFYSANNILNNISGMFLLQVFFLCEISMKTHKIAFLATKKVKQQVFPFYHGSFTDVFFIIGMAAAGMTKAAIANRLGMAWVSSINVATVELTNRKLFILWVPTSFKEIPNKILTWRRKYEILPCQHNCYFHFTPVSTHVTTL